MWAETLHTAQVATKPRHRKTAIQLWVLDNRKRLGLESSDLAKLTGLTLDTARGWESRGRPSEDAIEILEKTFGVAAPRETEAIGDQSSLVNALAEQTQAINRLIDRLDSLASKAIRDGVADAIREAAALRAAAASQSEPPNGPRL